MSFFVGTLGNDTIKPGTPLSTGVTVDGSAGSGTTPSFDGDDTIYGLEAADNLAGGAGNDFIDGGVGTDTLLAGDAGDDTIQADAADTVTGGDDNDRVLAFGAFTGSIDGGIGTDTVQTNGTDLSGATLTNVERLEVVGSTDTIRADQFDLFDTIAYAYAGVGSASFQLAGSGTANLANIDGSIGSLYLYGNDQTNAVTFGGAAQVYFYGGTGDETITSGSGNDTLYGSDGSDTLSGGSGNDFIDGGVGTDTLSGGTGNDTIYAGGVDGAGDTLDGGADNDELYGLGSGDKAYGGTGNDIIQVDGGTPTLLDGGGGTDTLRAFSIDLTGLNFTSFERLESYGASLTTAQLGGFSEVGDPPAYGAFLVYLTGAGTANLNPDADLPYLYLYGNAANTGTITVKSTFSGQVQFYDQTGGINNVTGGGGADSLYGYGGNDTLSGNGGNDTVDGGFGNDRLLGGAGTDTIRGGEGTDTLYGNDDNDTLYGDTGRDTVYGGAGADVMVCRYGEGADLFRDFSNAQGDKLQINNGEDLAASQVGVANQGVDLSVSYLGQQIAVLAGAAGLTASQVLTNHLDFMV